MQGVRSTPLLSVMADTGMSGGPTTAFSFRPQRSKWQRLRWMGQEFFAVVIIVVFWAVSMWFLTGFLMRARMVNEVHDAKEQVNLSAEMVSSSMDHHLDTLRTVPNILALMPSTIGPLLDADAKRATETLRAEGGSILNFRLPDDHMLPLQLAGLAASGTIKNIMVLTNAGDCLAVAGFLYRVKWTCEERRFSYLIDGAVSGNKTWFGVWPTEPGLFHVAPVLVGKRRIGLVAAKIDLSPINAAIADKNAFVTDEYGVVIATHDPAHFMRVMPVGRVNQLSAAERMRRYGRVSFEPLEWQVVGQFAGEDLIRWGGDTSLNVSATRSYSDGKFYVYATHNLNSLAIHKFDRFILFSLLFIVGALLTLHIRGIVVSLKKTERHSQEISRLNEILCEQASTDALTGIANRRYFFMAVENERQRGLRHKTIFSLLQVDFDRFKQINDHYGHAAGDDGLRHVVSLMQSSLRAGDVLGRTGGDEFAVLLPLTDAAGAQVVAQRMCDLVAATALMVGQTEVHVSLSIGVSQWRPESPETLAALMARADQALYLAKEAGKNRVQPEIFPAA